MSCDRIHSWKLMVDDLVNTVRCILHVEWYILIGSLYLQFTYVTHDMVDTFSTMCVLNSTWCFTHDTYDAHMIHTT